MDEFRDLLLGRVKENNMIHDDTKKNITDKLEEFKSISEEAKFNSAPIEVGDNFKVYNVMYDGKMSTAKVLHIFLFYMLIPSRIFFVSYIKRHFINLTLY